jgi:hypothetical protein
VTVRNAVSCHDVSPSSTSPVIGPTAIYSNSSAAWWQLWGLSARLSKLLSLRITGAVNIALWCASPQEIELSPAKGQGVSAKVFT